MKKDYYSDLGIANNASQDDIKKAFRKLAHQHHPDKQGGDEKRFKEINEAYQVLSDPQKRQQYDQYGHANHQAGAGFSWEDMARQGGNGGGVQFDFGDLGDVFGDMFGFGGSKKGARRDTRGSDLQIDIDIELKEAITGLKKELRIPKSVKCDACAGSGAEPGSKVITCPTCAGSGQVATTQRTILGVFQSAAPCSACKATGKKIEKKCKACSGDGRVRKEGKISVSVPAGIDDGQTLRLSGEGEAGSQGAPAGDLYVRIHVRSDKRFARKGDDLYSDLEVSYSQAALGDKIKFLTHDGMMEVKVPAAIQTGQLIRLSNLGLPHLQKKGRGDLYIRIVVATPKSLNRKQKELFEQLKREGL
ncbi:molecular chaperone DnaJ [Candidatus Uhrbacteria bacterium]|nr:molecular chaperone DnaJ [Candidatus Uhrbacteria bacterium]